MSFKGFNRLTSIFLAVALVIVAFSGTAVANGAIYINNSSATLPQSLASSYAIGSGGNTDLIGSGSVYAMTSSGIQQISGSSSSVEHSDNLATPPQSNVTTSNVTVTAAALSGTVSVKTSTVKIGLQYKTSSYDTTVASTSLTNVVGSGYSFGYYDSSRVFHSVGSTSETRIGVLKDTNVAVGSVTVGCYHIKLPGTYSTFDEANSAAGKYTDGFPAYYSGKYYVLVGNYKSSDDAKTAMEEQGLEGEAFSASSACIVVIKAGTNNILFEFDNGSGSALAIHPISSGKAETTLASTGFRYYGDFEFLRYGGGNMSVISVLGVEDYVKGVIPYEMSSSWPLETLKAGAIAARNYVQYNYRKYATYGFDIFNDAKDQVYRGINYATSTTDKAVDETKNQYLTYKGALCACYYFSSDGGATESSENIWTTALGYCRGKADPFEAILTSGVMKWSNSFTSAELGEKLGLSEVIGIETKYTDSGNMYSVKITDVDGGTKSYTKSSCLTFLSKLGFSYTSMHYTITYDKQTDTYTISGSGWGHNIGMSQWGAYSMAKNYGYNYREILGFYYTDVAISQGV